MPAPPESSFVRFLSANAELEGVRDGDKALKIALRTARDVFGAQEACVARFVPGRRRVQPTVLIPPHARWDWGDLTRFLGDRRPKMPPGTLVAPILRHGRPWAVMALRRSGEYDLSDVRDVGRVGDVVSRTLERIDRDRLSEVRNRIDRKVLEQLRPNDLFYQILHGLRSLTRYDHSAAVLIQDEEAGPLRLVAEQVTWRKGKSSHVGITRGLDETAAELLASGEVFGFDREHGKWREWRRRGAGSLAAALDYNTDDERREMCLLCAPLTTRDGLLGVLKVANSHPRTLGEWEADLVRGFLPQAAVAIRNLARTTSLESSVLAAERKHVMANLARGVSHDVNNALGSMIPLVQQMLTDARTDGSTREVLVQDLEQLESSLQVCRRIFGGMLSFAKGSAQSVGEGNVRRAVESTLAVLEESLRRQHVRVELSVPDALPPVRGSQGDLEQLLLNLASNARDAMPDGGELAIRIEHRKDGLEIEVADTGSGIPEEHRARVKEPFFTTKPQGSGLGLSICRSIIGTLRGRLTIESEVGEGTRVAVRLPVHAAPKESRDDF